MDKQLRFALRRRKRIDRGRRDAEADRGRSSKSSKRPELRDVQFHTLQVRRHRIRRLQYSNTPVSYQSHTGVVVLIMPSFYVGRSSWVLHENPFRTPDRPAFPTLVFRCVFHFYAKSVCVCFFVSVCVTELLNFTFIYFFVLTLLILLILLTLIFFLILLILFYTFYTF